MNATDIETLKAAQGIIERRTRDLGDEIEAFEIANRLEDRDSLGRMKERHKMYCDAMVGIIRLVRESLPAYRGRLKSAVSFEK